jgi:hypothetical protein
MGRRIRLCHESPWRRSNTHLRTSNFSKVQHLAMRPIPEQARFRLEDQLENEFDLPRTARGARPHTVTRAFDLDMLVTHAGVA